LEEVLEEIEEEEMTYFQEIISILGTQADNRNKPLIPIFSKIQF